MIQRKDEGRPEIVYGRRCKQDNVEHEVMVAELEVLLCTRIERKAKAGTTHADGRSVIHGRSCFIEVDRATMGRRSMQAKWRRYEGVSEFILVVTVSDGRLERLRQWSELVQDRALFTTFDRLRAGRPWVDRAGGEATLGEFQNEQ